MTPAEALSAHLAKRPQSPGPVKSDHPAYVAYHKALCKWIADKEALQRVVDIPVIGADELPDADLGEDAPKPKTRPAWSGATPEYMTKKKREQRERDAVGCVDCGAKRLTRKDRCLKCQTIHEDALQTKKIAAKKARRALIRSGLAERKGETWDIAS